MEYAIPLVLLVGVVLLMAGAGKRAEQSRSLLLVFAGIAIATALFWLVLSRT